MIPTENKPKPTISVIMAVYNAEPFLSQAIQSILEQTLKTLN